MQNAERPLGRRKPPDWKHVKKYPFMVAKAVENVEVILELPEWHEEHDQGSEGACVGFGGQMMSAIVDKKRFDPWWLWDESKKIDIWPDTNPGDSNGTSVRASMDVLREQGNKFWQTDGVSKAYGIKENRWATTVDEMRTAIANKIPVVIGVNWYTNFDNPVKKNGEWWIGRSALTDTRGGHCVCVIGASDKRQAFLLKNSWGKDYPLVWIPYKVMQRLLDEDGEATLITDNIESPNIGYNFTKQLTIGSRNEDVRHVQKWLNAHGYIIATSGLGSPGNESNYYGALTRAQVQKLQVDKGIASPGVAGYGQVGVKTRAYLNANR